MSVLNVGFGLGIVDRLFQATRPMHHVIIEAHPQVLAYMKSKGVYEWPGVKVLEGRWQDFMGERMGELIEASGGMGFDAIFVDTFAEGYEGVYWGGEARVERDRALTPDLKAFFEVLPDILEAEHGIFSFWNGLGATSEAQA